MMTSRALYKTRRTEDVSCSCALCCHLPRRLVCVLPRFDASVSRWPLRCCYGLPGHRRRAAAAAQVPSASPRRRHCRRLPWRPCAGPLQMVSVFKQFCVCALLIYLAIFLPYSFEAFLHLFAPSALERFGDYGVVFLALNLSVNFASTKKIACHE